MAADSLLMRQLDGWTAKGGAEGLLCAAGPGGLGIALKVEDGAMRAVRPALAELLRRLGLDPGDTQLLARYERWRGLDSFMVALATDGLTRLFGIPGKLPSAVRRLGMGVVQRTPALKHWFMDEARGMSGELPELLRG